MKTYLIISNTNYGIQVQVVNASTAEAAKALAPGAWPDAEVVEIDTKTPGLVQHVPPTGG